jgi:hypothetical protein
MIGILKDYLWGPSKAKVWRQLAEEIGGQYVKGNFLTGSKVQLSYGPWTITLDTYVPGDLSDSYTRLSALYVGRDNFHFTVHRKNILSNLHKYFGMQDVEVDYSKFDKEFIIQGNNESRLRELFQNHKICELIRAMPFIYLYSSEQDYLYKQPFLKKLCLITESGIKDIDCLWSLFELIAEMLDQLNRIGAVTNDRPVLQYWFWG